MCKNIDDILTAQLKDFDTNLTIATACFLLLIIPMLWISPMAMHSIITTMIDSGYFDASIWECWQFSYIPAGLDYANLLIGVLWMWFVFNVAHMICLAIDEYGDRNV
jgi:hypothetical protein